MSHQSLWILVCLLAAVSAAQAQERLTLAGATAPALAKNHEIRKLFSSGARASAWSLSRESTNNAFILYQPAYFTSRGVDLRQLLLWNRAIDPTRAALRVTALDRDRSGAALDRQVLQSVAEVESAYWGRRRIARSPNGSSR